MHSDSDQRRWLTPEERATWVALVTLVVQLPAALDAQLQDDEGLSFFEYMVLAMLSEREDRTLQMSELAAATSASLSRLSHAATRLEAQGFLRRERLPGAGRRTRAELTETGYAKVLAAAPAHVQQIRTLLIDPASPDQLRTLREVCEAVVQRLGSDGAC